MATKAALEKELKELTEALELTKLESENRLKVLDDANRKAVEVSAERDALAGELAGLKARKEEGVSLPEDHKAQLVRLEIFLGKLYRESEHPGVRQDILDWRKLLGTLTAEK